MYDTLVILILSYFIIYTTRMKQMMLPFMYIQEIGKSVNR